MSTEFKRKRRWWFVTLIKIFTRVNIERFQCEDKQKKTHFLIKVILNKKMEKKNHFFFRIIIFFSNF